MESKGCVSSSEDRPVHRWSIKSEAGLPYGSLTHSVSPLTAQPAVSPARPYVAIAVLCFINLLNYMERYTVAGILPSIQAYFDINNSQAGLIQTVFIISFILLAPLFGYLGDRYNRTYIMIGGLLVWIVTGFSSSFVTKSYYWLLIVLRAMVGVGEASCTIVAPTIIGDLYTGGQRSKIVCLFYICVPLGSGLGFIIGSSVTSLTGDWHWALRITPILGLVGIVLLFFLCPNPPRGASETHGTGIEVRSTWLEDVKYLLKIKSYVWSSVGVTATVFTVGSSTFWMPTFLTKARIAQGLCAKPPCSSNDSLYFGIVTLSVGVLGAFLGTFLSRRFRDKKPNVDPLICAAGILGAVPFFLGYLFMAEVNIPATYFMIVLSGLLVSLNWAVMADILLYIIMPTRRSTGEALQITVSHLLGDAISPYLIGLISDAIRKSKPWTPHWDFNSLQYSFLFCTAVSALGGVSFLMCAFYISKDAQAVVQSIGRAEQPPSQPVPSEPSVELNNQPN